MEGVAKTFSTVSERQGGLGSSDIVRRYLKEMKRFSTLTAAEEIELTKRMGPTGRPGESAEVKDRLCAPSPSRVRMARNELVERNLALVLSVAKNYINRGVPFLDLVQEGNMGLMLAADKFDPSMGYKFSTSAYFYVKAGIFRAFAKAWRAGASRHAFETESKLLKAHESLGVRLGRDPTLEELSEDTRVSVRVIRKILELSTESVSPNETADGDGAAGERDPSPEERAFQKEMAGLVWKALSGLPPREEKILRLRFGIGEDAEWTLQKIAHEFGFSRERAPQIEVRALEALREDMRGLRGVLCEKVEKSG